MFENEKEETKTGGRLFPQRSEVNIPTAHQMHKKSPHQLSGLTGIRTASDFLTSSEADSSDIFEADSDQDLHSKKAVSHAKMMSFIREISKEYDDNFSDMEVPEISIDPSTTVTEDEIKEYYLTRE